MATRSLNTPRESAGKLFSHSRLVFSRITTVIPIALIFMGLFGWLVFGNVEYFYFFLGMIFNETLNRFLKMLLGTMFNTNCFVYRPVDSVNCGYLGPCEDKTGKCRPVGMPSETVQAISFALGFWGTHLLTNDTGGLTSLRIAGLIFFLVFVAGDRVVSKCNKLPQVVIAIPIGIVTGAIWYNFMK